MISGTKIGGIRAAKTVKRRYGSDFYVKVGKMGGDKSTGGGFASTKVGKDGLTGKERAAAAGSRGGQAPRKKVKKEGWLTWLTK